MEAMQTVVTAVFDCKILQFETVEDILDSFEHKVITKTVPYIYL